MELQNNAQLNPDKLWRYFMMLNPLVWGEIYLPYDYVHESMFIDSAKSISLDGWNFCDL